ncbi:MAG: hypothetical protein WBP59_16635 [Ilumatobacteraceae bacterium]
MVRRVLALCVCVVALASCRVDVEVDMTIEPDGTGTIAMQLTADAELIAEIPTVGDELATDDVVAAGWTVDGPTATDDGGLTVTFSHPFASDEEATNLLNSLGPPFNQMAMVRNTAGDDTTTRLSGLLGLADGFASFADEDLVAAVGSLPFADQIAAAGATPAASMSATLRVTMPGEIDTEQTNGTVLDDGRVQWTVPLDGTILEWRALSVQSPGDDRWWARPLSIIALVTLIGWIAIMTLFIGYVAVARWQRAHRRRRPPPPSH